MTTQYQLLKNLALKAFRDDANELEIQDLKSRIEKLTDGEKSTMTKRVAGWVVAKFPGEYPWVQDILDAPREDKK